MTTLFFDYNLLNLVFVESKSKMNAASFGILIKNKDENEKIKFKCDLPMLSPFGVEKYNYKYILNLEFTNKSNNNNMYNFFTSLWSLDKFFNDFKKNINFLHFNVPNKIKELIKDKQYSSFIVIRKDKFDPLLRLHLKFKNNKIETDFYEIKNNNQMLISCNEIKNKFCQCHFEVGPLWFNKQNFGVILYVNSVNLV
jgi:hypothetical protein